jgi:hypothetical protein
MVEIHNSKTPNAFISVIGVAKLAIANPAKISAMAVIMLAGRQS